MKTIGRSSWLRANRLLFVVLWVEKVKEIGQCSIGRCGRTHGTEWYPRAYRASGVGTPGPPFRRFANYLDAVERAGYLTQFQILNNSTQSLCTSSYLFFFIPFDGRGWRAPDTNDRSPHILVFGPVTTIDPTTTGAPSAAPAAASAESSLVAQLRRLFHPTPQPRSVGRSVEISTTPPCVALLPQSPVRHDEPSPSPGGAPLRNPPLGGAVDVVVVVDVCFRRHHSPWSGHYRRLC